MDTYKGSQLYDVGLGLSNTGSTQTTMFGDQTSFNPEVTRLQKCYLNIYSILNKTALNCITNVSSCLPSLN